MTAIMTAIREKKIDRAHVLYTAVSYEFHNVKFRIEFFTTKC